MAVLRPHLALTVSDVERSTEFYRALFGVEPTKERPGYAKFEVAEPALNFTLNEGERGDGLVHRPSEQGAIRGRKQIRQ